MTTTARYHVSRNVVRNALSYLSINSIVELRPGKGAYVMKDREKLYLALKNLINEKQITFQQSLEVREILEIAIIEKSMDYITGENIKELKDIYNKMEQSKTDKEAFIELDSKFHSTIANFIPNPFFSILLTAFYNIVECNFFMVTRTLETAVQDTQNEHLAIICFTDGRTLFSEKYDQEPYIQYKK